MRVAVLTREYPPDVYGGAGVHVEYLTRELAKLAQVDVHCWGADRVSTPGGPTVHAYAPWDALAGGTPDPVLRRDILQGLRERVLDQPRNVALEAIDSRPERDIVEDGLRKGVRTLEHHANSATHLDGIDLRAVGILTVVPNLP